MKKLLKNKIITGTAIAGFGLASLVIDGCGMTPEGRQFSQDMFRTYMHESIAKEVWGSGQDRVEVNVYKEQEQIRKIYTYKIVNLDTEKEEIEVVGENNYRKYVFNNFNQGRFPEKGYVIVLRTNGKSRAVWQIKNVEKCEGYLQIIKEANPSPETLLPYTR